MDHSSGEHGPLVRKAHRLYAWLILVNLEINNYPTLFGRPAWVVQSRNVSALFCYSCAKKNWKLQIWNMSDSVHPTHHWFCPETWWLQCAVVLPRIHTKRKCSCAMSMILWLCWLHPTEPALVLQKFDLFHSYSQSATPFFLKGNQASLWPKVFSMAVAIVTVKVTVILPTGFWGRQSPMLQSAPQDTAV